MPDAATVVAHPPTASAGEETHGMPAGPRSTPDVPSGHRPSRPWYMQYWVWVVIGLLIIGGMVAGTVINPLPLPAPASTPAATLTGP